jgi:excisionase family DNA binding protein
MFTSDSITLTQAAARLRMSYNQALRLVLKGELRGWQDERGRWRVCRHAVEEHAAFGVTLSERPAA